jgi:hypothetical protein
MRHMSLEDGRRRRTHLLWCWIAAVIAASIVWLTYGPELPARLSLLLVLMVAAAIAVPSLGVGHRNFEVEGWYLRGQCLTCGYDLRANEDRCPKCGRQSGPLRL